VKRKNLHLWIGVAVMASVLTAGSAVASLPKPMPGAKQPAAGAPAVAIPLRATLSASQVASLQVASTATGRFLGALVRQGLGGKGERPNVSWSLVWALGVRNTTGPVTGVEIRSGEVSATAASIFLTLCSPCGNVAASAVSSGTTLLGGTVRNLTQAQMSALRRADLFVNVTTAANPAGELRGPITRRGPVTTSAPPNNRIPNPLKPGAPKTVDGP
jgi:hypothetical protein